MRDFFSIVSLVYNNVKHAKRRINTYSYLNSSLGIYFVALVCV